MNFLIGKRKPLIRVSISDILNQVNSLDRIILDRLRWSLLQLVISEDNFIYRDTCFHLIKIVTAN